MKEKNALFQIAQVLGGRSSTISSEVKSGRLDRVYQPQLPVRKQRSSLMAATSACPLGEGKAPSTLSAMDAVANSLGATRLS